MRSIGTILSKLVDSCLISFKLHNNVASIQRNRGDKSHRVITIGSLKLQLHDAIYRLRFYSNSLTHILSLLNSHNDVASIQKNWGDKSHRVIVALGAVTISLRFHLLFTPRIMSVQYSGGCSVLRGVAQYMWGIALVLRRQFSTAGIAAVLWG